MLKYDFFLKNLMWTDGKDTSAHSDSWDPAESNEKWSVATLKMLDFTYKHEISMKTSPDLALNRIV